jgi:DNA-directed RNA polymerase subunit M/transcription elongation factor TFIIS
MPIQFHCQACRKLIRTPDRTAGKRAECPYCGELMPIPAQSEGSTTVPGSTPQSAEGTDRPHGSGDERQAIEFPCPNCTSPVRTPASAVGKRGKCPSCEAVFQIPQPSQGHSAGQAEPTQASVGARHREQDAAEPASIEFACPACGKSVRTPATAVGKKGRCPKCGGVMQIPPF